MLPWQPFLAVYIWGAHWCHLKNMTEPSMCGGDAALCQITLTTCYSCYHHRHYHRTAHMTGMQPSQQDSSNNLDLGTITKTFWCWICAGQSQSFTARNAFVSHVAISSP